MDAWVIGAVKFFGGQCKFTSALEYLSGTRLSEAAALFGEFDTARGFEQEVASSVKRLRTGRSSAGRLVPREALTEDDRRARVLRIPTAADIVAMQQMPKPKLKRVRLDGSDNDSDDGAWRRGGSKRAAAPKVRFIRQVPKPPSRSGVCKLKVIVVFVCLCVSVFCRVTNHRNYQNHPSEPPRV